MDMFYRKEFRNWSQFRAALDTKRFSIHWVFRGACQQSEEEQPKSLSSSLERACIESNIPMQNLPEIENEMIRDFRRTYDGSDRQDVETDILYCLSLMRHYGAPTRLLDWTYSPYVAAYFALEQWSAKNASEIVVWCLSDRWCYRTAINVDPMVKRDLRKYRKAHEAGQNDPQTRKVKNDLFIGLFMENRYRFIYPVNPYHMHARLSIQRGVFLCPGDIRVPLVDILIKLEGLNKPKSMVKFIWRPNDEEERLTALDQLHRMNINRATLFPGLDGFSVSLKYRLRHYDILAQRSKRP